MIGSTKVAARRVGLAAVVALAVAGSASAQGLEIEGRAFGASLTILGQPDPPAAFSDTGTQTAPPCPSAGARCFDASAEETVIPLDPLLVGISGPSSVTAVLDDQANCRRIDDPTPTPGTFPGPCLVSFSRETTVSIFPGAADPADVIDVVDGDSEIALRCEADEPLEIDVFSNVEVVALGGNRVFGANFEEDGGSTVILAEDLPLIRLNHFVPDPDNGPSIFGGTMTAFILQPITEGQILEYRVAQSRVRVENAACQVPSCLLRLGSFKDAEFVSDADGDSRADDGDRIRYTITLVNSGSGTCGDVQVIDRIPRGVTPDLTSIRINGSPTTGATVGPCPGRDFSAEACPGEPTANRECLSGSIGTVPAGSPVTISFEADVTNQCEPVEGRVCNVALVDAQGDTAKLVNVVLADQNLTACPPTGPTPTPSVGPTPTPDGDGDGDEGPRLATTGGQGGCSVDADASVPPGAWLMLGLAGGLIVRRSIRRSTGERSTGKMSR